MEDCYGLMGLKVNVDWPWLFFGGVKLFHCIVSTGVMAYYAPNKFSSLLFSPGTLSGHVDNVV